MNRQYLHQHGVVSSPSVPSELVRTSEEVVERLSNLQPPATRSAAGGDGTLRTYGIPVKQISIEEARHDSHGRLRSDARELLCPSGDAFVVHKGASDRISGFERTIAVRERTFAFGMCKDFRHCRPVDRGTGLVPVRYAVLWMERHKIIAL